MDIINWKHKIDLSKIFERFDNGEITVKQVARMTVKKLSKIENNSLTLLSLIECLNNVSAAHEYDDCIIRLYYYGDKHGIFIKT